MKRIITALTFVAILYSVAVFMLGKSEKTDTSVDTNLHKIIYFDEAALVDGVSKADNKDVEILYSMRGGVTPHHLLASYIIADFFKKLAVQKPETIIIVGPNHEDVGSNKVVTSKTGWKTNYGVVGVSTDIVDDLVSRNLAAVNGEVLESDQSVSALLPFVSFYMPSVKVVPLLLSSKMNNEDIIQLSGAISKYLKDEKTVLVSSVDFSHYLSFDQANARDLESISSIKKFGCEKLIKYDSDYMDSASSICTLLYSMLDVGATNIEILNHDNSANIQKSGSDNTTSYFSILFR